VQQPTEPAKRIGEFGDSLGTLLQAPCFVLRLYGFWGRFCCIPVDRHLSTLSPVKLPVWLPWSALKTSRFPITPAVATALSSNLLFSLHPFTPSTSPLSRRSHVSVSLLTSLTPYLCAVTGLLPSFQPKGIFHTPFTFTSPNRKWKRFRLVLSWSRTPTCIPRSCPSYDAAPERPSRTRTASAPNKT